MLRKIRTTLRTRFHLSTPIDRLLERKVDVHLAPDALFWFHLRRMGFWLPVMTAVIWGLVIFWVMELPTLLGIIGTRRRWAWAFDLCPYCCLCVAAMLCGIRFSGAWPVGKDRKNQSLLCMPATVRQVARARLLADGVALFGTLCGVSLVYVIWLFTADDGLLFSMATAGLASGYASLREVLAWVTGVPIIAGVAAWVGMSVAYRPIRRFVILVFVTGITVNILYEMIPHGHGYPILTGEQNLGMLLSVVIAFLVVIALLALRQRSISLGTIARSCVLWGGLTLALYPFEPRIADGQWFDAGSLLVSAAVGAAMILPYYAAVLDISRRRRGKWDEQGAAVSSSVPDVTALRVRRAGWVVLMLVALLVAWIRWPAEPAVCALWRSQGLPATPQELNALYPPVNDDENLALRCLEIRDRYFERFWHWEDGLPAAKQANRNPKLPAEDLPFQVLEHLLIVGYAKAERGEALPLETLYWSREFWESVGRETADELHKLADSGLAKSRYPIDLSKGIEAELPHFVRVRDLTRVLQLEAILGAVVRHPPQVAEALRATFRIADSLAPEPLMLSQIVRTTLLPASASALEVAMGRTSLSDAEMQQLQECFATALPPLQDGHMLDKTILFEQVALSDALRNPIAAYTEFVEAGGGISAIRMALAATVRHPWLRQV